MSLRTVNGQVKTDPSKTKLKCMGTVFQKKLKDIKRQLFKGKRKNRLLRMPYN
jgi:hypothetical protein